MQIIDPIKVYGKHSSVVRKKKEALVLTGSKALGYAGLINKNAVRLSYDDMWQTNLHSLRHDNTKDFSKMGR